jgi:DNA-binding response OmpR family regulator
MAADMETGAVQQPAPSYVGSGRRRVLVVDDNQDYTISCARLPEYAGHDVRIAFDGLHALDVAREYRPEVALLDVGLPGIDGYQLARQLRAAFGPTVLLIIITAYARDKRNSEAGKADFDHFFIKPVDFTVIIRLLASGAPFYAVRHVL